MRRNLSFVMILTCATNLLVLAIPIYLFQISDRVFTSRSIDTLIMLTIVIAGAVILQAIFDAIRRFILMRTAVEVAVLLGAPVLSASAHAPLHDNGRQYQTLGDLQLLRSFLVSGTLISFLDVPFAPLFILANFLVHPHLGLIVIANQRTTPTLQGEVFYVSADAILDRSQELPQEFYVARISVPPNELGRVRGFTPTPGMPAQIMIKTQNRSFVQYLIKPVPDSMTRAFREQ